MRVLGLGFGSLPYQFDGDDAVKVELSLDGCRYAGAPESRFGHNAMAEARTLLRFSGRCDGCNQVIDLTGEEARDRLFVHTVDPQIQSESPSLGFPDWPAVVCRECRDRMADEGHATFVDYKFSLNPACPQCQGRRASEIFYGMPSDYPNIPPWEQAPAGAVRRRRTGGVGSALPGGEADISWHCSGLWRIRLPRMQRAGHASASGGHGRRTRS